MSSAAARNDGAVSEAGGDIAGTAAGGASPRIGVILLVPDRWKGVWMPRHQVAQRLARHFEVVWMDAPRHWRSYLSPNRRRERVYQDVAPGSSGCTIFDPSWRLPDVYRPRWLRAALQRARLRIAARMLRRKGCSRIVLYLWRPEFAWALDVVRADLTCYHIDDEYRFATDDLPNDPHEVELIRRVDQVFIHSQGLLRKKGTINRNTQFTPNGVDYAAYATPASEPADLAAIAHPRMGYVGVLKTQLDFDLLLELARRNPQWSFVAVGPEGYLGDKAATFARWRELPNVHLLGNRSVAELPAYAQHMDVSLMPYEVNSYTNYIFPLKLHEYLAAGRPVVARPIETLIPFGDVVRLATSMEEWQQALTEALLPEANSAAAVEARRARARDHDWGLLVANIADHMRRGIDRKTNAVTRQESLNC